MCHRHAHAGEWYGTVSALRTLDVNLRVPLQIQRMEQLLQLPRGLQQEGVHSWLAERRGGGLRLLLPRSESPALPASRDRLAQPLLLVRCVADVQRAWDHRSGGWRTGDAGRIALRHGSDGMSRHHLLCLALVRGLVPGIVAVPQLGGARRPDLTPLVARECTGQAETVAPRSPAGRRSRGSGGCRSASVRGSGSTEGGRHTHSSALGDPSTASFHMALGRCHSLQNCDARPSLEAHPAPSARPRNAEAGAVGPHPT